MFRVYKMHELKMNNGASENKCRLLLQLKGYFSCEWIYEPFTDIYLYVLNV